MANETINNSIISITTQIPTYEQATAITHSSAFIISLAIVWALTWVLMLILGASVSARDSYNRKISGSSMLGSLNFWYLFIIVFLIQGALLLLIVFPIWISWLG